MSQVGDVRVERRLMQCLGRLEPRHRNRCLKKAWVPVQDGYYYCAQHRDQDVEPE